MFFASTAHFSWMLRKLRNKFSVPFGFSGFSKNLVFQAFQTLSARFGFHIFCKKLVFRPFQTLSGPFGLESFCKTKCFQSLSKLIEQIWILEKCKKLIFRPFQTWLGPFGCRRLWIKIFQTLTSDFWFQISDIKIQMTNL